MYAHNKEKKKVTESEKKKDRKKAIAYLILMTCTSQY
jgi:hypothetical protein